LFFVGFCRRGPSRICNLTSGSRLYPFLSPPLVLSISLVTPSGFSGVLSARGFFVLNLKSGFPMPLCIFLLIGSVCSGLISPVFQLGGRSFLFIFPVSRENPPYSRLWHPLFLLLLKAAAESPDPFFFVFLSFFLFSRRTAFFLVGPHCPINCFLFFSRRTRVHIHIFPFF